jgi:hypothetical protein
MTVPIRSVKFWINAFIPRDIPGYTRVVPAGPHRGLTMIPGPSPVSDCFLTDQRTFSNNIHAKSRMHAEVKVDVSNPTPTLSQWHNCDYTTECDCEDGDVECLKKGNTSRMSFSLLPNPIQTSTSSRPRTMLLPQTTISYPTGAPRPANQLIRIRMDCAASNPCSPSSRLFGDIDFTGTIEIDIVQRTIEFNGLLDQFPAFEAYATINDGAGVTMFQESPPTGNTVMNLPGKANRPKRCRLQDSDGDGIFDRLQAL